MPSFTGDIFGLPSNDSLSYSGSIASDFEGRGAADVISGGSAGDVIHGDYKAGENLLDGADRLSGNGGNDSLYGGGGRDTLFGGTGDDYLNGGSDVDHLYGGSGSDDLWGGSGGDYLSGDSEADYIRGGTGGDTLIGGTGNDYLRAGSDDLFEVDRITGGTDSDTFVLTNADRNDNDYDNALGLDRALITDWRQGAAQDRIYLAAETRDRIFTQLSNGQVFIFERGISDPTTGLSTPNELLAQVSLGTSSGLTSATFQANVEANLVFV